MPPGVVQQSAQQQPDGGIVRRQGGCPAQQRLGVAEVLLVAHVCLGEATHRVDVVGAFAQRLPQRLDGLSRAARAEVFERDRYLALVGILLDVLLERLIGLRTAAERGERLAELAARQRQPRLELDRPLQALHRFLEALLHAQKAAEVLVQMRKVRLERQRLAHDLLSFGVARLFHERVPQHAQVIDAAGTLGEEFAADGLGAVRPVSAQRLERRGKAGLGLYFRYLSNHPSTRSA